METSEPLTFTEAIKDTSKLPQWIQEHQTSVTIWGSFSVFLMFVVIFLSDRDFSFLLTFSSMISMMSFGMVLFKIEMTKSVAGVSGRMMTCYLLVLFFRLISIVFWEGYLPWDRTGDWLYQTCEAISLILCGVILYAFSFKYNDTASLDSDSLSPLIIIAPCFVVALLIHPNLNNNFIGDFSWAFALYLEAFSALPQLLLFHRESRVEPFTIHFLAAQCLSKLCSFIFWCMTASELNGSARNLPGVSVLLMQAIQLIIMADFIYHYISCLSRGVPVQFILKEKV